MINTVNVILFLGLISFALFDLGVVIGRKRERRETAGRLAAMRRHPSNHIRVIK